MYRDLCAGSQPIYQCDIYTCSNGMQIIVQEIDAFTYCWISKTTKAVCICMMCVVCPVTLCEHIERSFIYLHRFWITSMCSSRIKTHLRQNLSNRPNRSNSRVIWKPRGGANPRCIYVRICRWVREWVKNSTNIHAYCWCTIGNSFLARMTFNKTFSYRYSDSILDLPT